MTRFQTKYSKVAFGWENGGFRQISSTYDSPPVANTEFQWTERITEIDISDAKPSMERTQKHYHIEKTLPFP